MDMLFVEIIGTILVWRHGWGPWALLPIVGALIAGPVIASLDGGVTNAVYLADLGCVVALAAMYSAGSERSKPVATPARPTAIPAPPTVESEQRKVA